MEGKVNSRKHNENVTSFNVFYLISKSSRDKEGAPP